MRLVVLVHPPVLGEEPRIEIADHIDVSQDLMAEVVSGHGDDVEIEPGGRLIIGLREAVVGGAVAGVVGAFLVALIGRMRR